MADGGIGESVLRKEDFRFLTGSGNYTDDVNQPNLIAAIGFRTLSMRPASIGPVKSLLSRCALGKARDVIDAARERGDQSVRSAIMDYVRGQY